MDQKLYGHENVAIIFALQPRTWTYFPRWSRQTLLLSTIFPMASFTENLVLGISAPGFDRGKLFIQKISVAKRWIIIHSEIRLNGMADWEDCTRSLTVLFNC